MATCSLFTAQLRPMRVQGQAIKKFVTGHIVGAAAIRDVSEASVLDACVLPKQPVKPRFCASCAHSQADPEGPPPPPHLDLWVLPTLPPNPI